MLPKKNDLIRNGGVYRQKVRCGKARCRCTRGEMHVAHYFISRPFQRQRKLYIPKAKLAEVQEVVDSSRELRGQFRQSMRRSKLLIRTIRDKLRDQSESRDE